MKKISVLIASLLKSNIVKSLVGLSFMRLLSVPLGLLTSIILARHLGAELFGDYVFFISLLPILALPVAGGLIPLITREVAKMTHDYNWHLYRGIIRSAYVWVTFASSLAIIIYLVASILFEVRISENLNWLAIGIVILMIPFKGFAAVRIGAIKGFGKPAFADLPEQLIQPIILLFLALILVALDSNELASYLWAHMLAMAIVFVISTLILLKVEPIESKNVVLKFRVKEWATALVPFSLLAFVSIFNAQISTIILGLVNTSEQVSALHIADRSGQLVVLSLALVNGVISPYIVKAFKQNDVKGLQRLAINTARGSFVIALPIALLFVFFGQSVIGLLFGDEFSKISVIPVAIVAIAQLVNVFFGPVGFLLSMTGFENKTLRSQIVALIVNIAICLLLAPTYGAVGASIAFSMSIITWNLLMYYSVKTQLGLKSSAFSR